MRRVLSFSLVFLLLVSCSTKKHLESVQNAIHVKCPENWKISDASNYQDEVYYLALEKRGWNSSGLFIISRVDGKRDLNALIDTYQEIFKDHIIAGRTITNYDRKHSSSYAGMKTLAIDYSGSILGIAHVGKMHVFHCGGHSYVAIIQEAVEDHLINKPGFNIIENNFSCS